MRLFDVIQSAPDMGLEWLRDLQERSRGVVVLDVSNGPLAFDASVGSPNEDERDTTYILQALEIVNKATLAVRPPTLPLWVEGRGRHLTDWWALLEFNPDAEDGFTITSRMMGKSFTLDGFKVMETAIKARSARRDMGEKVITYKDVAERVGNLEERGAELLATYWEPEFVTHINLNRDGTVASTSGKFDEGGATGYEVLDILLALALLHCRNVSVVEHQAPRHERRRAQKEGLTAPTKYYVLEIDNTLRRVVGQRPKGQSVHDAIALHMVRGHFKTFTQERPLFGRATGTYWWDSQVRGDAKRGAVAKDYASDSASFGGGAR